MDDPSKDLKQDVKSFRKQLAEIESKRNSNTDDIPSQFWKEFSEVSHQLEMAEEKLKQACWNLVEDMNKVRADIISGLEKYNLWREKMFTIEKMFLVNIIRPGYQLKTAIKQREHLERAYQRINNAILAGSYHAIDDLKSDIRRTLSFNANAFTAEDMEKENGELTDEFLFDVIDEVDPDFLVEAFTQEELNKEFKRIVLPKVHPDTSDTPEEVFNTVFDVYQKQDSLLMEAYIIEYKGEINLPDEFDSLETVDQITPMYTRYQRLMAKLKRRIDRLFQKMSQQEMEDPQKLQKKMEQQRLEIIERINSEGDQILYWRQKIEGLLEGFQKLNQMDEGE